MSWSAISTCRAVATPTSTEVADEIGRASARAVSGPADFVIAGDGFEMLAGPPDVGRILDAHPAVHRGHRRVRRRGRPSRGGAVR